MTHSDLASICAVEDCDDVGAFDVETDDGHYVSLLCKKHANELVSVTLPEGQRYVIEDAAGTGQYRIRDTRTGWSVGVRLADGLCVEKCSREVAEKLLDVVQLMEIHDN